MDPLTFEEIEFLQELVSEWQVRNDDLSQREWANAQAVVDKLEWMLNGE